MTNEEHSAKAQEKFDSNVTFLRTAKVIPVGQCSAGKFHRIEDVWSRGAEDLNALFITQAELELKEYGEYVMVTPSGASAGAIGTLAASKIDELAKESIDSVAKEYSVMSDGDNIKAIEELAVGLKNTCLCKKVFCFAHVDIAGDLIGLNDITVVPVKEDDAWKVDGGSVIYIIGEDALVIGLREGEPMVRFEIKETHIAKNITKRISSWYAFIDIKPYSKAIAKLTIKK